MKFEELAKLAQSSNSTEREYVFLSSKESTVFRLLPDADGDACGYPVQRLTRDKSGYETQFLVPVLIDETANPVREQALLLPPHVFSAVRERTLDAYNGVMPDLNGTSVTLKYVPKALSSTGRFELRQSPRATRMPEYTPLARSLEAIAKDIESREAKPASGGFASPSKVRENAEQDDERQSFDFSRPRKASAPALKEDLPF